MVLLNQYSFSIIWKSSFFKKIYVFDWISTKIGKNIKERMWQVLTDCSESNDKNLVNQISTYINVSSQSIIEKYTCRRFCK